MLLRHLYRAGTGTPDERVARIVASLADAVDPTTRATDEQVRAAVADIIARDMTQVVEVDAAEEWLAGDYPPPTD